MQINLENQLEQFRKTKSEDVYFSLLHLPDEVIPRLIQAFHVEEDTTVQGVLVEIIGQRHLPNTLEFLRVALQHNNQLIWKNALDGVVTQGGIEGLRLLEEESTRLLQEIPSSSGRIEWIEEAIQQIVQAME